MKKPAYKTIFIIGNPRSGKTLLQSLIGHHQSLAWLSQYHHKFPQCPWNGYLNRWTGFPFYAHPAEMRHDYVSTMSRDGSLEASDVSPQDKKVLHALVETELRRQHKNIFIADYGRPARISYFNTIFSDSRFIHVIRDGRAVVADLLQNRPDWYTKDKDLNSFYKKVPTAFQQALRKHQDHYTLALAALRWKMAIYEIERQSQQLGPNQYLLIKYEDIIADKHAATEEVLDWLDLSMDDGLSDRITNTKLYKQTSWKKYFSKKEKAVLQDLLGDYLKKYNYS